LIDGGRTVQLLTDEHDGPLPAVLHASYFPLPSESRHLLVIGGSDVHSLFHAQSGPLPFMLHASYFPLPSESRHLFVTPSVIVTLVVSVVSIELPELFSAERRIVALLFVNVSDVTFEALQE
jgi:hypothetical protein